VDKIDSMAYKSVKKPLFFLLFLLTFLPFPIYIAKKKKKNISLNVENVPLVGLNKSIDRRK
jgi:hypothetical protein